MSAMISWEVWLEYQFSGHVFESYTSLEASDSSYALSQTSSFERVSFDELPVIIASTSDGHNDHSHRRAARNSRSGRFSLWRRRDIKKAQCKEWKPVTLPSILKNRINVNESTEVELVKESDSESFDVFQARFDPPQEPPGSLEMHLARQVQLGNYYASER